MKKHSWNLFVSLNPELSGPSGHALYWDQSLKRAAEALNFKFASFCNRSWQSQSQLEFAEGVFSRTAWEVYGDHSGKLIAEQLDELFRRLEDITIDSEAAVIIYFYMGSPRFVRELAERLNEASHQGLTFVVNLFTAYFFAPDDDLPVKLFEAASAADFAMRNCPYLKVVTDSGRLREDIKKWAGVDLPLMPTMASQPLKMPPGDRATDSGRALRIVYPSDIHFSRGFELLCRFLVEYAEQFLGKVEFVIRLFPSEEAGRFRGDLEGLENVEILDGFLGEEEYRDLLISSDYVILPYPREYFVYRTSSILAECFSLRKPVIVMNDTWLADEVRSYRGGVVVESPDTSAMFAAVERCCERHLSSKLATDVSGMEAWIKHNNADRLFREIVAISSTSSVHREDLSEADRRVLQMGYQFAREREAGCHEA